MPMGEPLHNQNPYPHLPLTSFASFAVATVMFSTTTLIAIQMFYVKHWPVIVAIGFFLLFGFFDGESR